MNIFYLHQLPLIAAQYHCDKHVGKMLIESCQLLATAHHHFGNGHKVSYRPTHANHPSAIWVRQSRLNYQWLSDLASGLGRQFTLAMPDEYKSDDHLASYRKYYASKAATMPLVYNRGNSPQPDWLQALLLEEAVA
jgi:hypothetical protein